ncbi:acyl-CoA carboxylase subunit beta [Cumulibacter soli]|uniref:acyl-CoA carboxylase subunit beta n=1 Tax=Cumulibacter soli TaxID=2546344 RepID=UPI0010680377|nr:carboxyl transferase domain-containing protein [Cumulibacter soli]
MAWEKALSELERRRELARKMGGEERISRQHAQGKLTVRERIDFLVDEGSFREFGLLCGTGTYDDGGELKDFVPKAEVNGAGKIDGRTVMVNAGDFTVRGGSGGGASTTGGLLGYELRAAERAQEWQVPYIRLLDASGGSVAHFLELGRTYVPDANMWVHTDVEMMQEVPVVSALMGPTAGLPAIYATLAHFNVMVEGSSQLFPGGPPVAKAALGLDIDKETLGGAAIHTRLSGSVNNVASSEEDALRQIQRFLSYLPSNVHEMPPRAEPVDPEFAPEVLRDVVPEDPRRPGDARRMLKAVVDADSFFELAPDYGRSRITGLARIDGLPVGIMANNTRFLGGSTDVAAGRKAVHLLQLCDLFHLPMITLPDEPGVLVGPDSERAGIEVAGAQLVWRTVNSRMPWLTIIVGRLFGVGGQTHHRSTGMFRRYAWPSARWGSMHISGGTKAAFRSIIEAAEDPLAKEREIEQRLHNIASPFRTAEATGQDIIDPAESPRLIREFVADAQPVLRRQLGPPKYPYTP